MKRVMDDRKPGGGQGHSLARSGKKLKAALAMGLLAPALVLMPISVGAKDLNIFAAASLTEAFTELGREFENTHADIRVRLHFGGSNGLASQVLHGARTDVFASANQKQMDRLEQENLLAPGSRRDFAANQLVIVWNRQVTPAIGSLKDLLRADLKLVIADADVPVGHYTGKALHTAAASADFPANFRERVQQNVVSRELNVKVVYAKVKLGEADLGIVYSSDVLADDGDLVGTVSFPQDLQPEIRYPIAILKEARAPDLAATFLQMVSAPQGREILAKHGFVLPGKGGEE